MAKDIRSDGATLQRSSANIVHLEIYSQESSTLLSRELTLEHEHFRKKSRMNCRDFLHQHFHFLAFNISR